MISFLNPLFLAFGAAVLIPLALHLIQSSRTTRLPFSTLRFLKLARKRSSRRVKMENFLLWLLRTLLMALLALAFAMPMIRTRDFGNLLGRAARDVAIVLDVSYSMDYRLGRQTAWDQATDLAASVVEGLSEKDRFCVYLAADQVTPLVEQLTDKREETATRLRALKPSFGSSQLGPATQAALATLDQETRRTEREVHLITDGQRLPWTRFMRADAQAGMNPDAQAAPGGEGDGGIAWDPKKVNDRTTLFVTLLGAPAPENVAPVEVEIEPKRVTPETACQLTLRLARTGPPVETAVTVYLDDQEVGRRAVSLGAGALGETRFTLPPPGPGVHTVRVATPDDNLPVDNDFHLLLRAREKMPALCVGTPDNTLFLRTALETAAGGASPIEIKTIGPELLGGETLASYACIVLCNVLPLPGQEVRRLEQFAAGGGLLVMFPGDGASIGDYAAWSCLPSIPSAVLEVPVAERKRLLNWDKPLHPIIAALKEGSAVSPTVAIKRQLKCDTLKDKGETLVSTGAGYPFLLGRDSGRGSVLLFTVSADRSWSDFPLTPFFLPLAHQVMYHAAGIGAGRPYLWATDTLPLREFLPDATRESVLKAPDGTPVPVRSAVVEGETEAFAEGLHAPGLYALGGAGRPEDEPALAINMPRQESDLSALKPEDVPGILGVKHLHLASGKDDLLRKLEDFRVGKTLGEPLLWLALLVGLVEAFYANWLIRKRPRLTDAMNVEASGRVKDTNA
jgi:hypothetical protein